MILFKTHSEFEQQNVAPGAAQEGVGAFVESFRDRMVLPIDDPPDRLYGLIVHELTHSFENNIIPQGLIRRGVPLWVMEGLADYMRGDWVPIDLMTVRDAAISDNVPQMSQLEGYGEAGPGRLIYNLGHAVFEFIEARWGKEGIRGFLFALRKSVIGGGDDAYQEAFQMPPEEFDQEFDRYLKERFKAFRDKERPADYGADLSPDDERTPYAQALSIAPSPSGDLIASGHVESEGSRARHRPGFDQRRLDHPKPHGGLRQGLRLQPHRADGRRPLRDAVDVVVAARRSDRVLRADGQGTHVDRPERGDAGESRSVFR